MFHPLDAQKLNSVALRGLETSTHGPPELSTTNYWLLKKGWRFPIYKRIQCQTSI